MKESKMSELKACPFCGKEPKLTIENDHHGDHFSLGCSTNLLDDNTCPGKAVYYTEDADNLENAIKLWNTRPIEDALHNENKALRQKLEIQVNAVATLITKIAKWGSKSAGQTLPFEIRDAIVEYEMRYDDEVKNLCKKRGTQLPPSLVRF